LRNIIAALEGKELLH